MKLAAVPLVVMLVACGGVGAPSAAASISPTASATNPATPFFAPSPTATPGCQLPVAGLPPDATDPARRDVGFVSFPGGKLSLASDAITYERDSGGFRTISLPYLYGQDSEAYDAAVARWVPATHLLVTADGSEYAYQAPGTFDATTQSYGPSSLHIVQVASASDRLVNAQNAYPLAFVPEGLFAVIPTATASDPRNPTQILLLVDPKTGSTQQLGKSTVAWTAASGDYLFGTDLNPADPNPLIQSPLEPGPSRAPDRAWRLDLQTGTAAQWLYRPGRLVEVAGVDGDGHLIAVVVGFDKTEIWALTGPESGQAIYEGPGHGQYDPLGLSGFGIPSPGIADKNGFWLSSNTGVVLYSPGSEFKLVYKGQAVPVGVCS